MSLLTVLGSGFAGLGVAGLAVGNAITGGAFRMIGVEGFERPPGALRLRVEFPLDDPGFVDILDVIEDWAETGSPYQPRKQIQVLASQGQNPVRLELPRQVSNSFDAIFFREPAEDVQTQNQVIALMTVRQEWAQNIAVLEINEPPVLRLEAPPGTILAFLTDIRGTGSE